MWGILGALAAAPVVEVGDDHAVHGELRVPLAPAAVRAKLADPAWVAKVDASGTTVTVVERRGDCVVTDNVSPNVVKTVRYRVEQCPTASGFATTLVESNAFDAYSVRWTLTPDGDGTRIAYDLACDTTLLVPQFVIDQQTRKGVLNLLTRLQAELGG